MPREVKNATSGEYAASDWAVGPPCTNSTCGAGPPGVVGVRRRVPVRVHRPAALAGDGEELRHRQVGRVRRRPGRPDGEDRPVVHPGADDPRRQFRGRGDRPDPAPGGGHRGQVRRERQVQHVEAAAATVQDVEPVPDTFPGRGVQQGDPVVVRSVAQGGPRRGPERPRRETLLGVLGQQGPQVPALPDLAEVPEPAAVAHHEDGAVGGETRVDEGLPTSLAGRTRALRSRGPSDPADSSAVHSCVRCQGMSGWSQLTHTSRRPSGETRGAARNPGR